MGEVLTGDGHDGNNGEILVGREQMPELNIPPDVQDEMNPYIDGKINFLQGQITTIDQRIRHWEQVVDTIGRSAGREYLINALKMKIEDIDQAGTRLTKTREARESTQSTIARWKMNQRILNNESFTEEEGAEFGRVINQIVQNQPEIENADFSTQRAAVLMDFIGRRVDRKSEHITKSHQKEENPQQDYQKRLENRIQELQATTGHTNRHHLEVLAREDLAAHGIKQPGWRKRTWGRYAAARHAIRETRPIAVYYREKFGLGNKWRRTEWWKFWEGIRTFSFSPLDGFEYEKMKLEDWKRKLIRSGLQPAGKSEVDYGD